MNRSAVLEGSGKNTLESSLPSELNNPYFPHMYVDKRCGEKNKWTGERFWEEK